MPSDSRRATTDGCSPQPRDRAARRRGEIIYLRLASSKPREEERRSFILGQQGDLPARRNGRTDIAPDTYVIRFPGGDYEYVATPDTVPSVGKTIHRRGVAWLVTRVVRDGTSTVYVERADEQLGETG